MPVKIRMKYLRRAEMMKELERVGPDVSTALAAAQLKVAQDLARRIKPFAPANTGIYRESIIGDKLANHPESKALFGVEAAKDPNATGLFASYLWRWLEFGTVKMQARPHIFPVYRGRKRLMLRTLRRAVNETLKQHKPATNITVD